MLQGEFDGHPPPLTHDNMNNTTGCAHAASHFLISSCVNVKKVVSQQLWNKQTYQFEVDTNIQNVTAPTSLDSINNGYPCGYKMESQSSRRINDSTAF